MNIHDSVVQENIKLKTHDNNGREKSGRDIPPLLARRGTRWMVKTAPGEAGDEVV